MHQGVFVSKSENFIGLTFSHSQSSLLAYEEREIIDSFDEGLIFKTILFVISLVVILKLFHYTQSVVEFFVVDFERHEEPSTSDTLQEPKPPKRPSDQGDKSDRSPDESDVDTALKEGMNALKDMVINFMMNL